MNSRSLKYASADPCYTNTSRNLLCKSRSQQQRPAMQQQKPAMQQQKHLIAHAHASFCLTQSMPQEHPSWFLNFQSLHSYLHSLCHFLLLLLLPLQIHLRLKATLLRAPAQVVLHPLGHANHFKMLQKQDKCASCEN